MKEVKTSYTDRTDPELTGDVYWAFGFGCGETRGGRREVHITENDYVFSVTVRTDQTIRRFAWHDGGDTVLTDTSIFGGLQTTTTAFADGRIARHSQRWCSRLDGLTGALSEVAMTAVGRHKARERLTWLAANLASVLGGPRPGAPKPPRPPVDLFRIKHG